MTVALAMIAKDEADWIGQAIDSCTELVDEVLVVDTGSEDGTREVVEGYGGLVVDRPWDGFSDARNAALEASSRHDWVLMIDADMTAEAHKDLRAWLDTDPDPDVSAWQVDIVDQGMRWRRPQLTRSGTGCRYVGRAHEYLHTDGKQRPLLGLALRNNRPANNTDREWLLEQLLPEAGREPRATYYAAQSLMCLGRTDEAIEMYGRRAAMGGWEEERWHADYMRAKLSQNQDLLIAVWRRRPWRHEPLSALANIIRQSAHDDVLFLED